MGYYVNPEDMGQDEWLAKNGKQTSLADCRTMNWGTCLPVCLIDNGAFKAAGISYSKGEMEAFALPDRRKKTWFMVEKELLKPWYNP